MCSYFESHSRSLIPVHHHLLNFALFKVGQVILIIPFLMRFSFLRYIIIIFDSKFLNRLLNIGKILSLKPLIILYCYIWPIVNHLEVVQIACFLFVENLELVIFKCFKILLNCCFIWLNLEFAILMNNALTWNEWAAARHPSHCLRNRHRSPCFDRLLLENNVRIVKVDWLIVMPEFDRLFFDGFYLFFLCIFFFNLVTITILRKARCVTLNIEVFHVNWRGWSGEWGDLAKVIFVIESPVESLMGHAFLF